MSFFLLLRFLYSTFRIRNIGSRQAKVLVDGEWNPTIYKLKSGAANTIEFTIRVEKNQWEFFVWDEPYLKLWAREPAFAFESPIEVAKALGLRHKLPLINRGSLQRSAILLPLSPMAPKTEVLLTKDAKCSDLPPFLTLAADVNAALNEKIWECRYIKSQKHWRFELFRGDKTLPNSLTTAKKTWQNIQENLTLWDMLPPGSLPEADRQKVAEWERKQEEKLHKQEEIDEEKEQKLEKEPESNNTAQQATTVQAPNDHLPSFAALSLAVKPKTALPLAPVAVFA